MNPSIVFWSDSLTWTTSWRRSSFGQFPNFRLSLGQFGRFENYYFNISNCASTFFTKIGRDRFLKNVIFGYIEKYIISGGKNETEMLFFGVSRFKKNRHFINCKCPCLTGAEVSQRAVRGGRNCWPKFQPFMAR